MKLKYFELAKKLSKLSTHHTHPMGCVIVKGNRIIGVGRNKMQTHPKSPHPFHTIHCELDAILNSNRALLKGAKMYIYRETKDATPALAKPCHFCDGLLREVGIRTVYYSAQNSYKFINY